MLTWLHIALQKAYELLAICLTLRTNGATKYWVGYTLTIYLSP